jgi:hypothetical protein
MDMATIKLKWHTTAEVVRMLGFSLSKTKMLVTCGEIRPLKAVQIVKSCLNGWMNTYSA